mmetsp:Transcript_8780/g.22073  ORF Transcript_8780/g.22073 Transcript_8780/m.22073 type:complete len:904 (+) Transcript_8780:435-3146(+)
MSACLSDEASSVIASVSAEWEARRRGRTAGPASHGPSSASASTTSTPTVDDKSPPLHVVKAVVMAENPILSYGFLKVAARAMEQNEFPQQPFLSTKDVRTFHPFNLYLRACLDVGKPAPVNVDELDTDDMPPLPEMDITLECWDYCSWLAKTKSPVTKNQFFNFFTGAQVAIIVVDDKKTQDEWGSSVRRMQKRVREQCKPDTVFFVASITDYEPTRESEGDIMAGRHHVRFDKFTYARRICLEGVPRTLGTTTIRTYSLEPVIQYIIEALTSNNLVSVDSIISSEIKPRNESVSPQEWLDLLLNVEQEFQQEFRPRSTSSHRHVLVNHLTLYMLFNANTKYMKKTGHDSMVNFPYHFKIVYAAVQEAITMLDEDFNQAVHVQVTYRKIISDNGDSDYAYSYYVQSQRFSLDESPSRFEDELVEFSWTYHLPQMFSMNSLSSISQVENFFVDLYKNEGYFIQGDSTPTEEEGQSAHRHHLFAVFNYRGPLSQSDLSISEDVYAKVESRFDHTKFAGTALGSASEDIHPHDSDSVSRPNQNDDAETEDDVAVTTTPSILGADRDVENLSLDDQSNNLDDYDDDDDFDGREFVATAANDDDEEDDGDRGSNRILLASDSPMQTHRPRNHRRSSMISAFGSVIANDTDDGNEDEVEVIRRESRRVSGRVHRDTMSSTEPPDVTSVDGHEYTPGAFICRQGREKDLHYVRRAKRILSEFYKRFFDVPLSSWRAGFDLHYHEDVIAKEHVFLKVLIDEVISDIGNFKRDRRTVWQIDLLRYLYRVKSSNLFFTSDRVKVVDVPTTDRMKHESAAVTVSMYLMCPGFAFKTIDKTTGADNGYRFSRGRLVDPWIVQSAQPYYPAMITEEVAEIMYGKEFMNLVQKRTGCTQEEKEEADKKFEEGLFNLS